jgi:hypothetical protein
MILPALILGMALSADHHAPDPHHDAGGAAPGLHPHRLGQGPSEKLVVVAHALRNALIPW